MGSDMMYSKKSQKAYGPQKYFNNKTSMILLALTVLVFQIADYAVQRMANRVSADNNSNYWSQVDIFVGIFGLFYVSGHLVKKMTESSPAPPAPNKTEKQEAPVKERSSARSSASNERRVSFSKFVEKWEPKEKPPPVTFSDLPPPSSFVRCTQSMRASAPSMRASAPPFVPRAGPKVVPPPPAGHFALPYKTKETEEVGQVLFRSSCSTSAEQVGHKSGAHKKDGITLIKRPREDYNPWADQSVPEKPTYQSKWQPKEKTIWKSSHVVV
jgi:hypothetical protein